MNTQWDAVDHKPEAHAFRDALGVARQQLIEATADVCVIVGSNHFRGFWLDLMPPFTMGVDIVSAVGEHGTPKGVLPTEPEFAQSIHEGLLGADFDIAISTDMAVDHGISHAVQYLLPEGLPVVPIIVNVFGPPLPTLRRCLALGDALRSVIEALPGQRRVAVIGTGGLSHAIPFPDWRSPEGDAEEFLAESFRHGRGRWQDYEKKRRPLIVGAPARINEEFDNEFLGLLAAGELSGFAERYDDAALVAAAGNGGNEVRAWLMLAAALGHAPGTTLAYAPMTEWLTGMAVATIDATVSTSVIAGTTMSKSS